MSMQPDDVDNGPQPPSRDLPEETPPMPSMQEHDPVVEAAQEAVGVGAVEAEPVLGHSAAPEPEPQPAPAPAPEPAAVNTTPVEAIPPPKSSLKVLLPILLILAALAGWGFMPQGLDPSVAKLGKVTDKGGFFEIEYDGDTYMAAEAMGKIYPDLVGDVPKPDEGKSHVYPYSNGKVSFDVVGTQDTKPAFIRLVKARNYMKFAP